MKVLHAADLVDDPAAVAAHLRACMRAEACLVLALPALQARPGSVEAVLGGLDGWLRRQCEPWRRRWVFPARRPSLAEFCALATERARLRDPAWAALTPDGLVVTARWLLGGHEAKEQEHGARRWRLDVETRHVGPAEAIQEDEWSALARGEGLALRLSYDTRSGDDQLWEEALEPG